MRYLSLLLTCTSLAPSLAISENNTTTAADPPALFQRLSSVECGVDFKNILDDTHPLSALYAFGYACGAITVADFNGDTKPDLFFSGGASPSALYLQDGKNTKLHFSKVTCGVESPDTWAGGASAIDIDLDGDLDLYVTNYKQPNQLFINQGIVDGQLSFEDKAKEYGLAYSGSSVTPCFSDYDLDGDLDLFLLTNQHVFEHGIPKGTPAKFVNGKVVIDAEWEPYFEVKYGPQGKHELIRTGASDLLFRNEGKDSHGKTRFSDVTEESGIQGRTFGNSALWFDYNHDGYPDIYVANDHQKTDQLWHNNGDGTFQEVHEQVMPYCPWFSMGVGQGDLDGNGLVDIVLPDMAGSTHFKSKTSMGFLTEDRRHVMVDVRPHQTMRNCVLLDSGKGKFSEAAYMTGMGKTDWTWSSKVGDFDNDGKIDVFFTNGVSRNFVDSDNPFNLLEQVGVTEWSHSKHLPPAKETNRAFRNLGDLAFENTSKSWNLDHLGMTYGAAIADLDLDGDLDLVTCNLDEEVHILQNQQTDNHGLVLQLKGGKGNPHGVGALVTIESASLGKQVRLLQPSAGFMSFDSHQIHFGMGSETEVDRLTVLWPDGKEQTSTNIKTGQLHTISKSPMAKNVERKATASLFTTSGAGPKFTHQENSFEDYDDFQRQPLLPIRLSRGGPGMAWGDIDGDGDDDVYFGGARYQAGQLQINQGNGVFKTIPGPWSKDKDCEDMGIVWLDADRDGDLDLFVASGTPEKFAGSSDLKDRLYLNQGNLTFKKAKSGTIPSFSKASQAVSAVDYDRDGDLDLFIGSRSELGRYPMPPESRILRNDGTKEAPQFVDATSDVCPSLRRAGMITSSVWSDLDNNGWQDLVLALDYGPVRVFFNHDGKLTEAPEQTGLSQYLGWWNSVTTADLDGDGRMDIIAGNDGINTKYGKLKKNKTVHIHYGDMDNSGVPHIIESKRTPGKAYALPVRGKG